MRIGFFSAPSRVFLVGACLILAGCELTVATVSVPELDIPMESKFSNGAESAVEADLRQTDWWRAFGSAELDGIVGTLLTTNPDIAAASLRLLQADLNLSNARQRTPNVSAGAAITNTSATDLAGDRTLESSGEFSASVSWEADLWGRISSEGDAAAASLLVTAHDRDALTNSLIASVLRNYITLSFIRRDIGATERVVDIRRTSLSITQQRFERGVEATDAGSVNSAQENLFAAQSDLPRLALDLRRTINAIDVLTGVVPSSRDTITGTLPSRLPAMALATGTPLQLLDRRPDVLASAARLRAANANITVSVADRFPSLMLASTLRSGGSDIGDILDIDSIIASLVADLMLTVFDGGRGTRIIAIRQAEAEELAHAYVSTVLIALREVEDALSAETLLAEQSTLLAARLDAAREATQIARDRYRDGTGAYLTLLDAGRSEANAESAYLNAERSRWLNRVDLMLALGGRWSNPSVENVDGL